MNEQIAATHQELLDEIRERAYGLEPQAGDHYLGTTKPIYRLSTADSRSIVKDWIRRHPEVTPTEYRALLDSLARGRTTNELTTIGDLLRLLPRLRRTLEPTCIDAWLGRVEGWAETDSICQGSFTAAEMLGEWSAWKAALVRLSRSDNVHKRRASLVLLTRPVRESADPRLSKLAFRNIEHLKADRHILISKAISWLLRDLTRHHASEVKTYLKESEKTLPPVAVRETRAKLETGRKTPRKELEES
jgi:3-methyladenine DNA glycosylase AlkD